MSEVKVLRAKNGGHVYHIVGKKRGKLLIKNPADDLLPVEMTQEQADAIAVPAWEWDEDKLDMLISAHQFLIDRVGVNNDFAEAAGKIGACLRHIYNMRNGEL